MVHLHPARTLTISIYVYVDSLSALRVSKPLSLYYIQLFQAEHKVLGPDPIIVRVRSYAIQSIEREWGCPVQEPMQASPKRIEGIIVDWELLPLFLRPPFHIPTTPPVLSSLSDELAVYKQAFKKKQKIFCSELDRPGEGL